MSVLMEARKRKRLVKGSFSTSTTQIFSTKFLLLCLCLFGVFTLLFRGFTSGPFRPAPIVRRLAGLSSAVSYSVQDLTNHNRSDKKKPVVLRVENRVVFTDHVVVILVTNEKGPRVQQRIDCVYIKKLTGGYNNANKEEVTVSYPMMSADEYGEGRWIVQCPAPPSNYTSAVGLRGHMDDAAGFEWVAGLRESNQTGQLWDMLAYDAVLDGEDVVAVFVKGLHLRSDRESDASYFSCRFADGNSSKKMESGLTVKAITAAQEVIRCPIPSPVIEKLKNNEDVYVTVRRNRIRQIFPSIARINQISIDENRDKINRGSYKYELCGCSMVWNQAAFIKEWIAYHAWLGVQRWFVYDNNSDDGLKEVIDELDGQNYNVTRHIWPWVKSQEAGFSHCVLRARDECRWVGFFDVDEFYYFPTTKNRNRMIGDPVTVNPGPGSLRAVVDNVTLTLPNVGEIRTDCHSFGPSGLKKSPEEGVTLGYTCRMRNPERHKSIVRPDAVDDTLLNQVHHFKLKKEFNKTTLPQGTALINHYKYQVWDIFKAKFYRRVSTYVADWQENQNENSRDRAPGLGTEAIEPEDWHKRFCEVWDTGLRDFILANLGDLDTGLVPWGSI